MNTDLETPRGYMSGTGVIRDPQGNVKGIFEFKSDRMSLEDAARVMGKNVNDFEIKTEGEL